MDPWDAIDALEGHAGEPGFGPRWRRFVRACAIALPRAPAVAREWIAAADAFDAGCLSAEALTEVRVRAWQHVDARRAGATPGELAALHVTMLRLWPEHDPVHWHEAAWYFLQDCGTAGISESIWLPLLESHFPDVLGPGWWSEWGSLCGPGHVPDRGSP